MLPRRANSQINDKRRKSSISLPYAYPQQASLVLMPSSNHSGNVTNMAVNLSATLAANEDIERRRRAGQHVVNLAFGEAGLPVHPALREKLVAASGRNGYEPVAGASDLSGATAGYWTRRRLTTETAQVVCGPGSKSLLYGMLLAIGGDFVLTKPSWVSYAAQADLVGSS